ncbi:MAG: phosphatidylglycerophosphatase A [Bdellovibrionota bacterium]
MATGLKNALSNAPYMKLRPTERFAVLVASLGGAGYVPKAPGTMGTLVSIPLVYYGMGPLSLVGRLLLVAAATALAVWSAGVAVRVWGEEDCPRIVVDEMAGFMISLIPFPIQAGTILAAFALFRLFDIAKPWPCRQIDRNMEGGAGVVFDDLAAGVYTLLSLFILNAVLASQSISFYGLGKN